MKLTLIVLLAVSCLDCFVVMMERGSSMRELRLTKGGCHALIFAIVNAAMLFFGMQLSHVVIANHWIGIDRFLSAAIFIGLATFLLMKVISRKHYEEHLDLAFCYRKSFREAFFTSIDTIVLGCALGLIGEPIGSTCILMSGLTFIATYLALWIGYYLGAAYQRGMIFFSSLVYYAATLWILFPL